jgi:hypothetical protein
MDNWGDPWADNADKAKSPTKHAVISPLPPSFAPAPAFLGGFVDDAGWGNEDEDLGDWSTATVQDAGEPVPTLSPVSEPPTTEQTQRISDDVQWDSGRTLGQDVVHDAGDWDAVNLDAPKDEEPVCSETSDSSTAIQASDAVEHVSADSSARLQPDDDSSARASTSPSESSHNDVLVESPRTSYEEERGVAKGAAIEEGPDVYMDASLLDISTVVPQSHRSADAEDADQEVAQTTTPTNKGGEATESAPTTSTYTSEDVSDPPVTTPDLESAGPDVFNVDNSLLDELFAQPKENLELDNAPDDPIYSTSGRKAWYRLTRKQTMREFNNGNDDDNYIRVTWGISNVRSEVHKIVGRWAREDRISGTGPGARASFYWDTPASVDLKTNATHSRQRSSLSATYPNVPIKEGVPALSPHVPAAFNWSSAPVAADPWHETGPGMRSTSSPIAPMHPNLNLVHKQEARAVSLDLTPQEPEAAKHARSLTTTHETPVVANLISPPIDNTTTPSSDPWANVETLDVESAPKDDISTAPVDDEDDWGEMVSSPTVSTPTLTEPMSQLDTRNNTISTTATTPQSIRSIAIPDHSPDAMFASPIVRLRSTISPTSALFKANSFVPLTVERGPIGPSILKSAKRSASNPRKPEEKSAELPASTPKKPEPEQVTKLEQDLVPVTVTEDLPKLDALDEFSAWQTSIPDVPAIEKQEKETPTVASPAIQEIVRPSTPPVPIAAPAEPNVDAWADADFSFFESAVPTAPSPQTKSDPSDPFSVFESRGRSTSVASSAKTFTRSPPRKVTPPPVQPLTSATSSAQRRKTLEDGIIHQILSGLPDLGYMLR